MKHRTQFVEPLEPLERRTMLHASGQTFATLTSKGTLILVGLPGDDAFVVFNSGNGNVSVNHDGVIQEFNPNNVERISYDGLAGNDFVQVSVPVRTSMNGGDGNDTLLGGTRQDVLLGDVGADFLSGGSNNDTIDGGSGKDRIYGKGGSDSLSGGSGDDRINGGIGDDFINGGRDNDALTGGGGVDSFFGGTGSDSVVDFDGDDSDDGVESGV